MSAEFLLTGGLSFGLSFLAGGWPEFLFLSVYVAGEEVVTGFSGVVGFSAGFSVGFSVGFSEVVVFSGVTGFSAGFSGVGDDGIEVC